tara:strand:- start:22441 stop:22566 length:126 start_codon:yes stop_codon:yes gene_type:complete
MRPVPGDYVLAADALKAIRFKYRAAIKRDYRSTGTNTVSQA